MKRQRGLTVALTEEDEVVVIIRNSQSKCNRTGSGQRSWRRFIGLCAIGVVFAGLTGCVTELQPGQEPLGPEPKPVPPQPQGLDTTRVQAFPSAYLKDTNGNTQGDVIDVLVYLWSEPYPFPIHDRGTLTFELYRSGRASDPEAILARWSFPPELMMNHRSRTQVGPCYSFDLSLLEAQRFDDGQGDNLGVRSADLVVKYFDAIEGENDTPQQFRTGVSTLQLDLPLSN